MDSSVILSRDYALVQSLSDETIGARFEQQAMEAPDNLAIVTDERSLTYRELAALSDRIAARLHNVSTAHAVLQDAARSR